MAYTWTQTDANLAEECPKCGGGLSGMHRSFLKWCGNCHAPLWGIIDANPGIRPRTPRKRHYIPQAIAAKVRAEIKHEHEVLEANVDPADRNAGNYAVGRATVLHRHGLDPALSYENE